MVIRADGVPGGCTIWHPFGDDPGVLTVTGVTRPDGEGMVSLHAAELAAPLRLAGDWPINITH